METVSSLSHFSSNKPRPSSVKILSEPIGALLKKYGYDKYNSHQEVDFIVNLKHFNLAEISSAQLHDVVYLLNDEIIYCTVHVYLS